MPIFFQANTCRPAKHLPWHPGLTSCHNKEPIGVVVYLTQTNRQTSQIFAYIDYYNRFNTLHE